MDEFWVCQHCRSLNRAGTGRCYHCHQKFGSKPKESAPIARPGGTPGPAPFLPGAIGAGPAAVGGPGGGPSDDDVPAYYSRPVALAPTPVRDFSAPQAQPKPEPRFRLPSLTGWIRRRIAWSLATRAFVPVWFVGYLAAGLLTLLLVDGALIVTTLTPVARAALQTGSITLAWTQVDNGHQGLLEAMAIAFAVIGALALLFFSIFLGLSTHNAPGLGAATPYLTPYRAGTCWLAMLRTQARIAVGLLVPAALFWRGYALPGLIAALVAVELAQRNSEDPFGWLIDPARHLPDLFARLGVSGSSGSLVGTAWSICLRLANALAIVVYTLPVAAFTIITVATLAGRTDVLAWPSSGTGPFQLAIAALLVLLVLTTAVAVGLLVPISIELVDRQRTRRTLARVGRSRAWVPRPATAGAPAPSTSAPAQSSRAARWDPYAQQDERPDQASLNSPSTTSSFPWADEPSEDAPPD